MASFAILVIPEAHKDGLNRVLNILFEDSGDNLAQPLSSDGTFPPSHRYGGWPVTPEQAHRLQSLSTDMPTPVGGWPYEGVSEVGAHAAVAALYININTGENVESLPEQNQTTVFAALSLQPASPM